MKVLILGSGAMGCLYGAAFHRAGCAVTLVDVNREHVEAINASGLDPGEAAGADRGGGRSGRRVHQDLSNGGGA